MSDTADIADTAAPTESTAPPRVTHHRTCPLCEATCGLEITTEGDRVVRIRGDRNDPVSRGFICPKGSTLKQLHEDPDRLTSPVIRTDDGWRTATWDEAFAEIERRLQPIVDSHGRDALSVVLGNPNVHNLGGMIYLRHVISAVGSKRRFSASTVDQMPKHVSAGLMWGDPGMFPLPDIERTDYLLMLGANPWESNGSLVSIPDFPGRLQALRARGARFVVVDPRRTRTAIEADEHLTIRPGTDVLWLLALANVIVADGLVDIGRLAADVVGLDEACAAVAPYTPESVAARCGIDAATTRRIAHELAAAPSAAVYGRMGNHTVEFGTLASWAADLLNVLTGNLDRPGGVMFDSGPSARIDDRAPGGRGFSIGRWHSPITGRPEVLGELPAATLADEIEGSPGSDGADGIKALFLLASNPVRSFPNSERLDAALAGMELLVAVDPYINASTRHAHVILPPSSALERSHYDVVFESNMIRSFARYSPPVFDTDRPDEPEILSRLALVISGLGADADPEAVQAEMMRTLVEGECTKVDGPLAGRDAAEILEALAQWEWAEQVIDLRLRTGRFGDRFGADPDGLTLAKLRDDHPSGIDFGPLVERFPSAIRTASGRVELLPEPIAADLGRLAGSLPGDPDGLVLVGRRHLRSCNTWMHNVEVLVKGKERCTLQVHPDDAAELGLVDQGRATVTSRVGAVTAPVEITDEVTAGVVSLPFGWGHDTPGIEMRVAQRRPGVNSNILTDESVMDQLSGNAVLNAIPVVVEPC